MRDHTAGGNPAKAPNIRALDNILDEAVDVSYFNSYIYKGTRSYKNPFKVTVLR